MLLGVVRKQLELKFLGETKGDVFVTGDICLKSPSLDREVCSFFYLTEAPSSSGHVVLSPVWNV
jgi:hypothetical protein